MTKSLLQQFKLINSKKFPELTSLIQYVTHPWGSFHLNIPLEIIHCPNKGYGLSTVNSIHRNQNLLMVSADKCFTSLEYTQAKPSQSVRFDAMLEKLLKKSYDKQKHRQIHNLYKIIIQLTTSLSNPSFKTHAFAQYLLSKWRKHNLLTLSQQEIDTINSPVLQQSIIATRTNLNVFNKVLSEELYGIDDSQMAKYYSVIRQSSFELQQLIAAPIFDLLNHSFSPNCSISGIYLTHLRQSFLVLNSIRDISEGEELTVSYGQLSNYELFNRYGFTVKNNHNNFYKLFLDFEIAKEQLLEIYDFKSRLLKDMGGIKEFIQIYTDKIDLQAMRMLRVYFLTNQDILHNKQILNFAPINFDLRISNDNQRRVLDFILENLTSVDQTKFGNHTNPHIKQLQLDQKLIIESAIKKLNKELEL